MARQPSRLRMRKSAGGDASPLHEEEQPELQPLNSDARLDIIREVCAVFDGADMQREAINEVCGEARRKLKDNGISVPEVEQIRRFSKKTAEERAITQANRREAMLALGIGEQGTLFEDAAGKQTDTDADDPRPPHLRRKAEENDAVDIAKESKDSGALAADLAEVAEAAASAADVETDADRL